MNWIPFLLLASFGCCEELLWLALFLFRPRQTSATPINLRLLRPLYIIVSLSEKKDKYFLYLFLKIIK